MKHTTRLLLLGIVCVSACTQDTVGDPGYDYNTVGGASGTTAGSIGGVSGTSGGNGGTAGSGTAGSAGTVSTAGTGAGSNGTAGSAGVNAGTAGTGDPGGPCDLTGRWLVTTHYVTDALGAQQTAHAYIYYEIAAQGAEYVVTKGLYCGDFAHGAGLVPVEVHFEPSFAESRKRVPMTGRTATSTPSANGCDVHFAKWYTVRGATMDYTDNPTLTLPTEAQQASGGNAGWEDWDNDGKPGITGMVNSPVVTGKIFVAPRRWDEPQGTVPDAMTSFTLSAAGWGQEQNVMQTDPPDNSVLNMPSTVANNPALHFVGFARLADNQATGDDTAICDSVIQLAPTLTPEASKI